MSSRRRIPPAAILIPALGLFFAVLFGGQNLYREHVLRMNPDMRNIVIDAFTRWLLYAALAPAVGALVARFPLQRGHLRRWPLHILAAIGFAVLHAVTMGIVYRILHVYPREDSLLEAIGRLLMVFFGVNFVVFWAISGVYHALRYHREVVNREQLAAQLRARLAQSQLDYLRGQLNPHFLFNTLNAVSTLALTGERDQVVKTLSSLSDLLRVSLDRGLPQQIPLARELELLEGYLEIQRTRFGDRLALVADIDPAASAALLPSMMLQPLVENALQHGIEARPGPGRVTVTVRRQATRLCIRVEDTGPGFAAASQSHNGNGIGLSNTRARLEHLYGDAQSLECGNHADGGAFVHVVLPFHTAAIGEPGA